MADMLLPHYVRWYSRVCRCCGQFLAGAVNGGFGLAWSLPLPFPVARRRSMLRYSRRVWSPFQQVIDYQRWKSIRGHMLTLVSPKKIARVWGYAAGGLKSWAEGRGSTPRWCLLGQDSLQPINLPEYVWQKQKWEKQKVQTCTLTEKLGRRNYIWFLLILWMLYYYTIRCGGNHIHGNPFKKVSASLGSGIPRFQSSGAGFKIRVYGLPRFTPSTIPFHRDHVEG
jgi:hypothetical protein